MKASQIQHNTRIAAEKRHLQSDLKHILFWDINLAWTESELAEAKAAWDEGLWIPDIAERLRRVEYEVELLALEMLETGKWKKRKGAAYGKEWYK